MDDWTDPLEQISFLVRSEARISVLKRLRESGPTTQRALRSALEESRSTVARSLSALEDRGWIEREGSEYRLTPIGELVIEGFADFAETVRATDELSAFLSWFPLSEYDLELDQLRDAEITAHSPGDPYKPGRTQTDFLRSTSRFRGLLPSIELEGSKLVHERVVNGELDAEIIVSPSVERTLGTGQFAPLYREQLQTGRLTLLVSDEPLPFYLGIDDEETVQIGVEDDDGFPRALLESSEPSLAAWATDLYREYRATARPKSAGEL